MEGHRHSYSKDLMKNPNTPVKEKASEKIPKEPRISCMPPNYSAAALNIMEHCTGSRITQAVPVVKVPVQAVDAE